MDNATDKPAPGMTRLSGWGANRRSDSIYREPEFEGQLRATIDPKGTIARGLGRSYGDPAINEGGRVIGTRLMNRVLAWDPSTGELTCEAGLTLGEIIRLFGPQGWFPAITPGTKFVTVGGCIANDIHGKAHHAQGSFVTCVESMRVLLASGDVLTASRTENDDLFWGTFGGMGLLGIVLSATIKLRKIETTYFRQKKIHARDLAGLMKAIQDSDHEFPYSVATVDITAEGSRLGGGVLVVGDHATLAELPHEFAKDPLKLSSPKPKLAVPFEMPEFALNSVSIQIVNAAIMMIQSRPADYSHYEGFFYPLDMLAEWNRGYGKSGFTQYQFVIPFENGVERMHEIMEVITTSGQLPFLNVLKSMGKASGGILSFPKEGYTFAIDFPIRNGTRELTKKLDEMILAANGRIYLGKDSFVDAETFAKMYPEVERFLEIKKKYDPKNVFNSDLARRVGLLA